MPKKIVVPASELYDPKANRFYDVKEQTLVLEHSLVSLSKWERKYHRPWISDGPKTPEELEYYVKCMTLTQNVNPLVYKNLTKENYDEIYAYIEDPMTASWVNDKGGRPSREIVTAEIIYYWMIEFNIPVEFQKWHLNSLIMLIRVISAKKAPSRKMSKSEAMSRQRDLNAARRAAMRTRG